MESLLDDPQIRAAMIAAIVAVLGAIATFLRSESRLRKQRQDHSLALQRERETTQNDIAKINAQQEAKDKEHKRDLELMQAQITTERENQIRMEEKRLEDKLMLVFEARVKDLEARHETVKHERQQLRDHADQLQRELGEVQKKVFELTAQVHQERELREKLETDFQALKEKWEASKAENASLRLERNNLRGELERYRQERERLQHELDSTVAALAELERKLQKLEDRVGCDDEPPPTEPDDAAPPAPPPLTIADGAASEATVGSESDDSQDQERKIA